MVGMLSELMMFITPLWMAVIVGVLVGWAWKPRWAKNLGNCYVSKDALPASPASSMTTCFASIPILKLNTLKFQLPSCVSWTADDKESLSLPPAATKSDSRFVWFVFVI